MKPIPCLCLLLLFFAYSFAQKQTGRPKQPQSQKRAAPLSHRKKPLATKAIFSISDSLPRIVKGIDSLSSTEGIIFSDPEEMASYPGGEDSLMRYLFKNLHYPNNNNENAIEDRVVVSFKVCADGSLCHYEVKRSVSPSLDSEVLRVIKNMPTWEPTKLNGKAVPSQYTLPVLIHLSE
jgi:TonB family protein